MNKLSFSMLGILIVGLFIFNQADKPDQSTLLNSLDSRASVESSITPQKPKGKALTNTPQDSTDQKCHSNYSGCLNPNASDYDCAGGSGNGPYYTGRVKVLGYDVFGLDRDGDGWGCE